jgi:hypothetical protein
LKFVFFLLIITIHPYLGNVYIADNSNNRIRKMTVSTGIITTIAGTGASTYSGDNGPAVSATLNEPFGVALDSSGSHKEDIYLRVIFLLIIYR